MQTSDKPVVGFSELKIKSQFLLQNNVQQAQIVSDTDNSQTIATQEVYEDVPLSQAHVEATIKQYAEECATAGNRQLYATLIASKINLNGTSITIEITNDVQLQYLTNMKQDILDTLRKLLRNKQTQLTIVVSETANETKAFKPDDKFKMLSEKNPFLLELKKRFDLSVEY